MNSLSGGSNMSNSPSSTPSGTPSRNTERSFGTPLATNTPGRNGSPNPTDSDFSMAASLLRNAF